MQILVVGKRMEEPAFAELNNGNELHIYNGDCAKIYDRLRLADKDFIDVAVLDTRDMEDPSIAENAVRRLLAGKRPPRAQMRVIWIAKEGLSLRDLSFPRLIQVGVYDLIIPNAGHDVGRMLLSLIKTPNTYSNVAALNRNIPVAGFELGLAPAPKNAQTSADDLRNLNFGAIRTIAVAGAKVRSGSSTACLALARSFRLAGFSVSVVMSGAADFDAVKTLFPTQMNEDGAVRVGWSEGLEIDFWQGYRLSDSNQRSQIVIMDHGALDFIEANEKLRELESWRRMEQRRSRWLTADYRVLVSGTGMGDLCFLHDLLMGRSARELDRWSIFLNGASERTAAQIADGIHSAAPRCGVFRVPLLPDPLALQRIPDFAADYYAHISNGQKLEMAASPQRKNGGD